MQAELFMHPDVVVVGLGAMGAATIYQLARAGLSVVGIDRFAPPHEMGSSHGETRITRQGVGEGEAYVPLVLRSHMIWRELEEETGAKLLLSCGFLAIDGAGGATPFHGRAGFFERTVAAARAYSIPHELPTVDEARLRFPQFTLAGHEQLYYEPGGGLVYPERCVAAQLSRARDLGATLHLGEAVTAVEQTADGALVRTEKGHCFPCGAVVLAAGGWTPALVGAPLARLSLYRQILHWYPPADPLLYEASRCPTFIWQHGPTPEQSFYGFPIAPGAREAVKVATENYTGALPTPEAMRREVEPRESRRMFEDHVSGRLAGVCGQSVHAATCFYTFAPDGDFVIDTAQDSSRIHIVSACSGHGFKHSAGIGEHMALRIAGKAEPIPDFALARPALA